MCGFVGILGERDGERHRERIRRMAAAIAHRGPDGEGFHHGEGCSLGHRRLAIIDLERGGQPIVSPDGRHVIVFNGEIYNHAELRAELEARGHRFRTRVDTEVILEGWRAEGRAFLDRMRGMYAFAIWDEEAKRCFLARDPMGVKPLYYGRFDGRFYFASELKGILADPRVPRRPDLQALDAFLTFLEYPAGLTAFEGLRALEPGHFMEVEPDGPARTVRFFEMPFPERHEPVRDEEEVVDAVLEEARETVRLRLMSDVPLGCFLSGGVDSSLVVALMAEVSDRPVRTFSLVHEGAAAWLDESAYIRRVVEHLGTDHHEIASDVAWYRDVPALIAAFDQPCTTALNSWHVSKLASKLVRVALTGTGGDEGFAGYPRYEVAGAWWRQAPLAARARSFARTLWRTRGSLAAARDPGAAFFARGIHLDGAARRRLYARAFRDAIDPAYARAIFDGFFERPGLPDDLARCLAADQRLYLADGLHNNLDKVTMAHGLEGRVPLADPRFLAFANRLPSELKVKGGELKHVLKRAAARVLPREVIYRPKRGFGIPLRTWMEGELGEQIRRVLSRETIERRGLFAWPEVELLMDRSVRRPGDPSMQLWMLFVVELWHRLYVDSDRFLEPPDFEDLAA